MSWRISLQIASPQMWRGWRNGRDALVGLTIFTPLNKLLSVILGRSRARLLLCINLLLGIVTLLQRLIVLKRQLGHISTCQMMSPSPQSMIRLYNSTNSPGLMSRGAISWVWQLQRRSAASLRASRTFSCEVVRVSNIWAADILKYWGEVVTLVECWWG